MAVVQNLYQIFKIPASKIVDNNLVIKNYTPYQGVKDGNIVSIGDNIVFQQLRYLHNDFRDHRELFYYVQKLRNSAHYYKKQGKYNEARVLGYKINQVLFVPDVVNVFVDRRKSDFHKISASGFDFNGEHFVYLCSGAGQIRRNTATFINAKYRDTIVETINCGLDKKTSKFVLAKYSAYFALAFSSILWVRTPRVCVIKDFFRTLPNQSVDFICKDENGKSIVETRNMDLELNCADGQGLIDPEFAKLWASDMNLPFVPCSFVARSCFVKGNLATFDFKGYAHAHNISTIKDRWGHEYNIDEIDVLLSESQFKTAKYYESWQEYLEYTIKGKINWGVARYNKHYDEDYVLANYQYIQALDLSKEDIKDLIAPTIKWIQQICSGDPLFALLYCFGTHSDDPTYQEMYGMAQTNIMKAIIKNNKFLDDSYVQSRIYKNIVESINKAKIGKIWVKGNYQFMISDPVAQCQAALGLEPVGLIKKDEVYSNYWLKHRPEGCVIDLCRSPLIDQHEHNPSKIIVNNAEADYWYQYLNSGIIYSTYDTACYRHSDSDYDGDIVMSTDNELFIKGSHKNQNIITYEKGHPKVQKMTVSNITKCVSKGFGTAVGSFSNCATILYSMAAIFNKPEQSDMAKTLMTRIKLLREIVGQEIDRIKGADKPSLPSDWKHFEQISNLDDEETRKEKYKHNALVVSKKPYFFRYLYPELNKRFKQFEASYNQVSKDMFGIKFKKLLKKENKTPEEINLIKKYQKYSPLITSDCTMNALCKLIEDVDFDIKFARNSDHTKAVKVSQLPTYESKYGTQFDQTKYDFVKKLYQRYNSHKQIKQLVSLIDGTNASTTTEDFLEIKHNMYESFLEGLQEEMSKAQIDGSEFLFYCSRLAPTYSNFNWGFAWDVLEDQIIDLIPQGHTYCPIRSEDGVEYLGNKYKLVEITDKNEIILQNIINALFGIPEDIIDLNTIKQFSIEQGGTNHE